MINIALFIVERCGSLAQKSIISLNIIGRIILMASIDPVNFLVSAQSYIRSVYSVIHMMTNYACHCLVLQFSCASSPSIAFMIFVHIDSWPMWQHARSSSNTNELLALSLTSQQDHRITMTALSKSRNMHADYTRTNIGFCWRAYESFIPTSGGIYEVVLRTKNMCLLLNLNFCQLFIICILTGSMSRAIDCRCRMHF